MTNSMLDFAILCGDKLKESFPASAVEYGTDVDHEYIGETYIPLSIKIRKPRRYWLLTIRFFEDHIMTCPRTEVSDCDREISYNDPKLMDVLLSELAFQIRETERELARHE